MTDSALKNAAQFRRFYDRVIVPSFEKEFWHVGVVFKDDSLKDSVLLWRRLDRDETEPFGTPLLVFGCKARISDPASGMTFANPTPFFVGQAHFAHLLDMCPYLCMMTGTMLIDLFDQSSGPKVAPR